MRSVQNPIFSFFFWQKASSYYMLSHRCRANFFLHFFRKKIVKVDGLMKIPSFSLISNPWDTASSSKKWEHVFLFFWEALVAGVALSIFCPCFYILRRFPVYWKGSNILLWYFWKDIFVQSDVALFQDMKWWIFLGCQLCGAPRPSSVTFAGRMKAIFFLLSWCFVCQELALCDDRFTQTKFVHALFSW